jgi:hypothetical protein
LDVVLVFIVVPEFKGVLVDTALLDEAGGGAGAAAGGGGVVVVVIIIEALAMTIVLTFSVDVVAPIVAGSVSMEEAIVVVDGPNTVAVIVLTVLGTADTMPLQTLYESPLT